MSSELPRTLVVIVAMHRSGSSLVANVLGQLGMSLGPFPLLPADEHNTEGYFESLPFCELDRLVLQEIWGFTGDMPDTPEKLRRICDTEGRWPEQVDWARMPVDYGKATLRGLVDSAAISGFKDPRVPLAWPFWQRVLREFPGLRVIPVLVLRSPHEIAMSLFARSMGDVDYWQALEMVAVYLKRMKAIADECGGASVLIRFGTEHFHGDMRDAARTIGLPWQAAMLEGILKPASIHHRPARLHHNAQALFDGLAGVVPMAPGERDIEVIEQDSRIRENMLRKTSSLAQSVAAEGVRVVNALQQHRSEANDRLSRMQARIRELEAEIARRGKDKAGT